MSYSSSLSSNVLSKNCTLRLYRVQRELRPKNFSLRTLVSAARPYFRSGGSTGGNDISQLLTTFQPIGACRLFTNPYPSLWPSIVWAGTPYKIQLQEQSITSLFYILFINWFERFFRRELTVLPGDFLQDVVSWLLMSTNWSLWGSTVGVPSLW